ncbi:MAG: hypothetical protein AB1938_18365 [Myxococcota bacterium]
MTPTMQPTNIERVMQFPRSASRPPNAPFLPQHLGLVAFLALSLVGCQGLEAQFIGTRVPDDCNGEWAVCSTTVGCFLGDRSYIEGRFPGHNKVAIQLFEPSEVTVSFYLSETAGTGEETVINLFENSCSSRVRIPVSGRAFVGEAEQKGFVSRKADLSGIGDHLIDVESDARTKYLLKLDVLPLRLRDLQ